MRTERTRRIVRRVCASYVEGMAEQVDDSVLVRHAQNCERCAAGLAAKIEAAAARRVLCPVGFRAWRDDRFTPAQERLFLFLAHAPHPPSFREIGAAVGYRSTNGVADAIRILVRKGVVVMPPANVEKPRGRHPGGQSRGIQLAPVLPAWASDYLCVRWCPRCRAELQDAGRELSCGRCRFRGTIVTTEPAIEKTRYIDQPVAPPGELAVALAAALQRKRS